MILPLRPWLLRCLLPCLLLLCLMLCMPGEMIAAAESRPDLQQERLGDWDPSWYDADQDSWHIPQTDPPASETSLSTSSGVSGGGWSAAPIALLLVIAVLIAVVVVVVVALLGASRSAPLPVMDKQRRAVAAALPRLALPDDIDTSQDPRQALAAAWQQNDWRGVVIWSHVAILCDVAEHHMLTIAPGMTDRDCLRQLAGTDHIVPTKSLKETTQLLRRVLYGQYRAAEGDATRAMRAHQAVTQAVTLPTGKPARSGRPALDRRD